MDDKDPFAGPDRSGEKKDVDSELEGHNGLHHHHKHKHGHTNDHESRRHTEDPGKLGAVMALDDIDANDEKNRESQRNRASGSRKRSQSVSHSLGSSSSRGLMNSKESIDPFAGLSASPMGSPRLSAMAIPEEAGEESSDSDLPDPQRDELSKQPSEAKKIRLRARQDSKEELASTTSEESTATIDSNISHSSFIPSYLPHPPALVAESGVSSLFPSSATMTPPPPSDILDLPPPPILDDDDDDDDGSEDSDAPPQTARFVGPPSMTDSDGDGDKEDGDKEDGEEPKKDKELTETKSVEAEETPKDEEIPKKDIDEAEEKKSDDEGVKEKEEDQKIAENQQKNSVPAPAAPSSSEEETSNPETPKFFPGRVSVGSRKSTASVPSQPSPTLPTLVETTDGDTADEKLGVNDPVPVGYVPPPRKEVRIGYFEELEFERIEQLRLEKEAQMGKKRKGTLKGGKRRESIQVGSSSNVGGVGSIRPNSPMLNALMEEAAPEKKRAPLKPSDLGGCAYVLKNPKSFPILLAFAERLHCQENVLFIGEVVKYKKAKGKAKKNMKFNVFRSYIKRGSEFELNVDDKLYHRVLSRIANQELDALEDDGVIFDGVLDTCLKLIEEDLWPKFLLSDDAHALADKWKGTKIVPPQPLFNGVWGEWTSSLSPHFMIPPKSALDAMTEEQQAQLSPAVKTRGRRTSSSSSNTAKAIQRAADMAALTGTGSLNMASLAATDSLSSSPSTEELLGSSPSRKAGRLSRHVAPKKRSVDSTSPSSVAASGVFVPMSGKIDFVTQRDFSSNIYRSIFAVLDSSHLFLCSAVSKSWNNVVDKESVGAWERVARYEFGQCLKKPPKWFASELGSNWKINFRKLQVNSKASTEFTAAGLSFLFSKHGVHMVGKTQKGPSFHFKFVDGHQNLRFSFVSASSSHVAACTHDGVLYTWSYGDYPWLGHRTGHRKVAGDARRVYPLRNEYIIHVSTGPEHTLAATDLGNVYSWGEPKNGKLGRPQRKLGSKKSERSDAEESDSSQTSKHSKKSSSHHHHHHHHHQEEEDFDSMDYVNRIPTLEDVQVVSVCAGHQHSLALTDMGLVYIWGCIPARDNVSNQILTFPKHFTPLRDVRVRQLAAGGRHSLACSASGAVFSWGENECGQLGSRDFKTKCNPGSAIDIADVLVIAAGDVHSAAVTANGWVYTWGCGSSGQLGHGNTQNVNFPRLVTGLHGLWISTVSCGATHTIAVAVDGTAWAWGTGENGELGLGNEKLSCSRPNRVQFKRFALARSVL